MLLLDSTTGNTVATYVYDAFGTLIEQTGTADNSITYSGYQYDEETGLVISFDQGKSGKIGFEAVDHYHIHNPEFTNKKVDYYFDIHGKPVGKGSDPSHIVIQEGE